MPLFTSSFRTLPHAWRSLLIAVSVSGGFLVAYELFWRAHGFRPTLADSEALWCETRAHVAQDAVVILGSSRLQTGIEPAVLSDALGGRSVSQLAIAGANPVPALRDLADDKTFHGVVLLEYMPRRLFTPDFGATGRTQSFVATCKSPSVVNPIEARLDRIAEQHLAFLNDEVQVVPLLSYLAHHHALPNASHDTLRADRYRAMFFPDGVHTFSAPDVWDAPFGGSTLDHRLAELRDAIAKLQARGGRVILYRSPVSGDVLADEEARFPNEVWLARTARELGVPSIDYGALRDAPVVDSPDGEHPRSKDVGDITDAVARAMKKILE